VGAGAPIDDLQQLPATKGTVSRYTLTPRGDVDGLILVDGTEVHFPPHLSTQLVYAIKPGDTVTVRGLKALSAPLIAAIAITNGATGYTVVDTGPGAGPGPRPREARQPISMQGRVQMSLHGPRGDQTIVVQGDGLTTAMGRVVELQAIGPSQAQLNFVQRPGPPPRGPRP